MKTPRKQKNKALQAVWSFVAIAALGASVYAYYAVHNAQTTYTSDSRPSTAPVIQEPVKDEPPAITQTPVRITIDAIGVDAAIEPVGLTPDGMMDEPDTLEGVGWYNQSSPVGGDEYAMLLDGHYGTAATPAVFWRLSELTSGDIINVEGQGGATLQYQVVEMEQQYAEDVDMKKALYPYKEGIQSLTIITCEGEFDAQNVTYDKRTIVYAQRVL